MNISKANDKQINNQNFNNNNYNKKFKILNKKIKVRK